MARTNLLRPLSTLFILGLAAAGAACNGHVVSLGDTGNTQQSVTASQATSEVSSTAITCASGWAHPNICCSAASDSPTTCGAWEASPFQACEPGQTTYPNLMSC